MVRTHSGAIYVSMLLVCSGKFVDDRWAKASHNESASSCGLGCVGGLGAVPFTALILLHTSAELMLLLQSVIHRFPNYSPNGYFLFEHGFPEKGRFRNVPYANNYVPKKGLCI